MVVIEGLADTGALLALLDSRDKWHERCNAAFSRLHKPLGTTAAILAELFHLARRTRAEMEVIWSLVQSDAIAVLPIVDDDMPAIAELMKRYSDRPMDFADATLVYLAERLSTDIVFTIDHNDFETFRVHGRPFQISPARSA